MLYMLYGNDSWRCCSLYVISENCYSCCCPNTIFRLNKRHMMLWITKALPPSETPKATDVDGEDPGWDVVMPVYEDEPEERG
jgi:hypothetical protein